MAADFLIGIMQDKPGAAQQFIPLTALFRSKGIDARLQGYSNYPDAAMQFEEGNVDAMFAGSGITGTMIIKKGRLSDTTASPSGRVSHVLGNSSCSQVFLEIHG